MVASGNGQSFDANSAYENVHYVLEQLDVLDNSSHALFKKSREDGNAGGMLGARTLLFKSLSLRADLVTKLLTFNKSRYTAPDEPIKGLILDKAGTDA